MAENSTMIHTSDTGDKKPGVSRLPVYTCLFLLIISAAAYSASVNAKAHRDHTPDKTESPDAAGSADLISEERSFIGWLNDSAIFSRESYFANDSAAVSYQYCSPQCCRCDFDYTAQTFVGIRDDLPQGTVIYPPLSDHQRFFCRMTVDADSQFLNHIAVTLLNLDLSSALPSTPAALHVYLNTTADTTAEGTIILQEEFSLGPYHAENGIVFQLPRLKSAVLSEDRSVLLLEIIMAGDIEQAVVKIPRRMRRNR